MKLLVPAILFATLLVFGCTGTSPAATPTPAPSGPGGAIGTIVPTTAPSGSSGLPTTVVAAMALGVPFRCDVSTTARGVTESGTMWVKGQNYLFISTVQGMDVKMVKRDSDVYVWLPPQDMWLKSTPSATAAPSSAGTGPAQQQDTKDLEAATNIKCNPEAFGDEKFATPGKVQSMDDYIKAMSGGVAIPSLPAVPTTAAGAATPSIPGVPSLPAGYPSVPSGYP